MKHLQWIKKCPLLFLIIVIWIILGIVVLVDGRGTEAISKNGIMQPIFAILTDPKENQEDLLADIGETETTEDTQAKDTTLDETDVPAADTAVDMDSVVDSQETVAEDQAVKPVYDKYKKTKTNSPYYTDPGKIPLTTDYDYTPVKDKYFDDAVFIGDSRMVGMQDYSGLENATFLAKTGLTIYDLLDDPFVTDPKTGDDVTISYMLKHYKYGKIYLMVGINELGTGNTQVFQKAYGKVLKKIKKWQPDAVIYIHSIMAVTAEKSKTDPVFNNININDKNVAISGFADGISVFYFNVNALYTDKHGNLKADYTSDQIHLFAQYYSIWTEFLRQHGVKKTS